LLELGITHRLQHGMHGSINGTFHEIDPLVNIQKAMENCPFMVDIPIKNCDFP
jgi:hypothetical protein